jgi:azurin
MKKLTLTIAASVLLAGMASSFAKDKTEVTVTGNMVCAKCVLHETKTCQNVVQVAQGTNTVNYYLKQNDVSKAAHEPICGGSSEKVTVTGAVKEKDGKEMMTPTKIDVVKS